MFPYCTFGMRQHLLNSFSSLMTVDYGLILISVDYINSSIHLGILKTLVQALQEDPSGD